MTSESEREPTLTMNVERFALEHPGIQGELLVEYAREALGLHGASPSRLDVHRGTRRMRAQLTFCAAEPRTARTEQRPVFVEKGAVVVAGLVLMATEQLQITRVTPRGSRVDYFVGRAPEDQHAILEVGGTDEGSLAQLRKEKAAQLGASFYRRPPYSLDGFVSATRFAAPMVSALDDAPAEEVPHE